jgi:hypothetical protein
MRGLYSGDNMGSAVPKSYGGRQPSLSMSMEALMTSTEGWGFQPSTKSGGSEDSWDHQQLLSLGSKGLRTTCHLALSLSDHWSLGPLMLGPVSGKERVPNSGSCTLQGIALLSKSSVLKHIHLSIFF